jgi:hypothetical protein
MACRMVYKVKWFFGMLSADPRVPNQRDIFGVAVKC